MQGAKPYACYTSIPTLQTTEPEIKKGSRMRMKD